MGKHKTNDVLRIIKELDHHYDFDISKTKKGFQILHKKTKQMYHCHTDIKAFHPLRRFITNACNTHISIF